MSDAVFPLPITGSLPLALVAAVARNGVIGARNALPWRLPGDLKHFKAVTMGKPVLMGRRTWDSIGRPLPGRPVVVVSRDPGFAPAGATVARSIPEALDRARLVGLDHGASEIMLAGGGELYAALIGVAARLYITHVETEPDGDTRFPPIDPAAWAEAGRSAPEAAEGTAPPYIFVTYQRRAGAPRPATPP